MASLKQCMTATLVGQLFLARTQGKLPLGGQRSVAIDDIYVFPVAPGKQVPILTTDVGFAIPPDSLGNTVFSVKCGVHSPCKVLVFTLSRAMWTAPCCPRRTIQMFTKH